MLHAEPIVDLRNALGEGPVWDVRTSRLSWVNIYPGVLHWYEPGTRASGSVEVGDMLSAVVPRLASGGGFMAVSQRGFGTLDERGAFMPIAHPESHLPQNRFNDGKCDPAGRFWAGTMAVKPAKGAGSLYVMEPDHSVRRVLSDVTISNGLAWSADARTMYYIDSPLREVTAFDFDVSTGAITNRRTAVDLEELPGVPDGMCIDEAGNLWVAQCGGGRVTCWDPRSGKRVTAVSVASKYVTSCCFGGENMDELYITSATVDDTQPHAGALFVARPGVRGLAADVFAG